MRHFFSTSLQGKLSVMMLIATVIPLFFQGAFSYTTSARVNEEKTKQIGIDSLRRIQDTLRFIAQDVEGMSIFLTGDKDVQQYMSGFDFDSPERSRILAMTMNLIQSKEYISNITIYSKNKTMPLHTQSIYFSDLSKVIEDWDLSGKRWTSLYNNQTIHGSEHVFSFLRAVKSGENYDQLGFISISLNEAVLSRYLGSPNFGVGQGDIMLLNRQGAVISGNKKEWLTQHWDALFPGSLLSDMTQTDGFFNYGDGHDKKTVLYIRIPGLDWTLIGLVPYELYSKENQFIWLLTGTSVTLAAVLTSGLILFVVRHVTKPLKVLRRNLVRFDPNEPIPLYQFESPDEVGQLVGSYNKLGEHIKRLKEQLIMLETRKKEADIRALQAQINPHFLYNTLSSIHWIALMSKQQRIADMVGALSDFLRFSLNKGKDFCTVEQEINHVKNYALIQSIRYPKRFDIQFHMDSKIAAVPMLKLLLQPLVENAMIHGLKKSKRGGSIYISAVQEPRGMRFMVHDDGVGMAEEKLSKLSVELLQPLSGNTVDPSGSYGLRNVNERLLLHYGRSSQLQLESQESQGTRVSFIIPIKEHEDEGYDRG
ncbi:HAMP domain-containing protein [Paenibacillus sp. LMG 31456]|uniref:HAMP domain-containing protein n=1 Tax=Paenibacillus foliorum TaxID=2654974 RepID=A0A972GWY2_9BACL|nr:sensor histidine kinase [Paenibacillus foliorum]NOU98142.1 HAMP domain-containing protein [Paenibacillus foliorum]